MTKIQIISELCNLGLRQHLGTYTLEFREGPYHFYYHKHDTGQSLKIFLTNNLLGESLLIYNRDIWNSSRYSCNSENTIQGYQHNPSEPWVEDCNKMFEKFKLEIEEEKLKHMKEKIDEEQKQLSRFRELFNR